MPKTAAAGAGTTEELVDVLALALAGQFHQTKLGQLGNLRPRSVIPNRRGEVLQQLQLIPAGIHIDEIDDDHAADVAQLQLAGDLDGRLTIGPQHGLPCIGRPGEGARVHVNDGESLRRFDDHVPAGRQVDPRLQGVTDGGVDLEVLQQLARLAVGLHQHLVRLGAEKTADAGDGGRLIHHHSNQVGAGVIPQDPVDEILVPIEQHRRSCCLGSLLNRFPLPQKGFEIINQLIFSNAIGFGADQQTCSRRLDQHTKSPQAIAFRLRADPARDIHPLTMGLQHQVAPGERQIAGESRPLGAGWLLHHLHQHLLPRFQQFGDAGRAFLQAQWAQIRDVDEPILFAFSNVDEGCINAGENVLNGAEVDVTDLVTTLGNDQFINSFIGEHSRDAQLLRDDNLLGHKWTWRAHARLKSHQSASAALQGWLGMDGPMRPEMLRSRNSSGTSSREFGSVRTFARAMDLDIRIRIRQDRNRT